MGIWNPQAQHFKYIRNGIGSKRIMNDFSDLKRFGIEN